MWLWGLILPAQAGGHWVEHSMRENNKEADGLATFGNPGALVAGWTECDWEAIEEMQVREVWRILFEPMEG